VACGSRPQLLPLRLELGLHAQVGLRRGEALDVAARNAEPPSIDLAIPDAKISARHARLEHCLDRWCVKDEKSKNGTFVNGARVTQHVLSDGDVVDLGDTALVFREAIAQRGELAYQPSPAARLGLSSLLPSVQAQLDELARMARSPITILLEGETGTGKEVIARAIHELAGRPGPLIPVNCGGIPRERVQAELFGWKRGAFTGAIGDHDGLVRAADRGTLFLDEIGDLPLGDQAVLLRVLQEREVLPIGGTRAVATDLRVVAATHRPLDVLAKRGAFREDLLARLAGYRLALVPLRERREDLGIFLAELLRKHRAPERCRVTSAALRALLCHAWPTNIRGLEQAIARALVACSNDTIDVDDLPPTDTASTPPSPPPQAAPDDSLRERLIALMHEHQGNVAAVARAMGKARMQIQRWLKRYRLVAGEFRNALPR
jgi:DNA-binding NtrC family response regulator